MVRLSPIIAKKAFKISKKLINNSNNYFKSVTTDSLIEIAKANINLTQETFNILKELTINPDEDVKFGAIDSMIEIVKLNPSLAREAFSILKELAINPDEDIKYEAIGSIAKIIKVIPSVVKEAFGIFKNLLNEPDVYGKSTAVRCIIEVAQYNSNIAQKAFNLFKKLFSDPNDYVKTVAASGIIEIVAANPSLIKEGINVFEELLSNNNYYVKYMAISNIAKIVKINPRLVKEEFRELFDNSEDCIKNVVANSIAKIIKIMPEQKALTKLKILIKKLNDYDKYTVLDSLARTVKAMPVQKESTTLQEIARIRNHYAKPVVASSIAEVVKANPSLVEEAVIILKGLLINHNTNTDVKLYAAVSLIEIVKIESNLLEEVFPALRKLNTDPNITPHEKHVITWILVSMIKGILFNKTNYKYINELLKIIDLTKTKDHYKELYLDAKIVLHKITDYITQEYEKSKNPEVIEWFTASFKELPNISETQIFLKEICKSILKSGVINEYESKFILNCIKKYSFTFTVSVSKESEIEGKIIFEDRSYEIFTTDNSTSKIVSLEEFATKLLVETDDPLAEQYKTHTPLFSNKGVGLKIAASDINNVSSITNENTKLSTEKYLLSYAGDNKDKFVMLLEKRSIFGDHLIYKFGEDNLKKIAPIYPAEINKELRGQLFNELESKEQFDCFIKNEKLKAEEEKQIFKCHNKLKFATEIIQDAKIRLETSNFKLLDAGVNKRLDAHEIKIYSHNKILKYSRTIQKAEIFREVESLAQESPLLYDYWNAFYWNIDGIIKACLIAETKIFKNNINEKEAIIKILAKSIGLITQNLLIDILTDLACSIVEARRERKRGNEVISMNDIIRNAIGMEDLDDSLKKIAINKTQERKNEIINISKAPISNSPKSQTKTQKFGNMVKEFVFPKALKRHDMDNLDVQLALKDSILFIESLYTNRDDILNKKNDFYVQDEKGENSNIV